MNKLILAAAIMVSAASAAQECSIEGAENYQQQLNKEYADPKESPLTKEDIKVFKALDFYAVDLAYCVEAKFVRTSDEKPFIMPTTGNYKPRYVKYGEVYFVLQGRECKLDVFRILT